MSGYSPLPTVEICDHNHPNRAFDASVGDGGTRRSLQERHLSMIALAGMIGTGLFLVSGKALAQAGPLGCVLGFLTMGTVTAAIALISAEMSAFKPYGGGFVRHASLWIDRSCGIVIGWNFWYSMAVTMPAELSAAITLLGFWNQTGNTLLPAGLFWLSITLINLGPVRFYGEFEFYFAFIKVAFIVAFIIAGMLLDLGLMPGGTGERVGLRFWSPPYELILPFKFAGAAGKFAGFWSTMIYAAFALGNVQVVAIAGAETRNPRVSIPKALKSTFARVIVFYVVSVIVISLLVPADDPRLRLETGTAAQSPFVIAFSRAGFTVFPSFCNAVILSSALSSANACTFLASRTLHGLALDGNAPAMFLDLNRHQVPYKAVLASTAWGILTFFSGSGTATAFLWLMSIVTTAGLVSWGVISFAYLRFFYALKKQGFKRDELPYKSPFQPYLAYFSLFATVVVVLTSGWTTFVGGLDFSSFLYNYLNCLLVPLAYFLCKRWLGDSLIPLDSIDFETEFSAIAEERSALLHRLE